MALSKIKGTVIADDAINADRIADGTVVASDLLDNTITGAKLATDIAITTSGNITTTGALTSIGIDDNAISTAITIDSSNKVGIGTSSPTAKLEINAGDTFQQMKIRRGTGGTDAGIITFEQGDGTAVGHVGGVGNGGLQLRTGSGTGTERMRLDSSGHAIIPAGVTLGTATGTYNAANTLDDYEEGTWTPTYVPETGSFTSVTYASTTGEYTKIGNTVYFTFYIQTNAITVGSASGNVKIGGLPFAPGGGAVSDGGGTVINAAYFSGDKPSYGTMSASSEINLFYTTGPTANDITLDVSDLGTGSVDNVFQMMGTYITTA